MFLRWSRGEEGNKPAAAGRLQFGGRGDEEVKKTEKLVLAERAKMAYPWK